MGLAGMPPVLLALLLAAWSPEAKAQAVAGLADTDAQVAAGGAVASTISLAGAGGVSETDKLGDFNINAQTQTTINICDRTP